MYKLLVRGLFLSLVTVVQAHAAVSDNCIKSIASNESWRTLSSNDISCLRSDVDFSKGLVGLCVQDQTDLSDHYKKYLEYASQAKLAGTTYLNATDPAERMAAHTRWNSIRRDWRYFGFQDEIDGLLAQLLNAKSKCLDKQK